MTNIIPLAFCVSLIAGMILLTRGLWPRRRGDTPYCRGCGYNLTGMTSERCPECGQMLYRWFIVRGERHISIGKTIAATVLLAFAICLLAGAMAGVNYWRFCPTFVLIQNARAPNSATASDVWTELDRRIAAKKLSASQLKSLFDGYTDLQPKVRSPIMPGDFMSVAVHNRPGFSNVLTAWNIQETMTLLEVFVEGLKFSERRAPWCMSLGTGANEVIVPCPVGIGRHNVRIEAWIERYYAGRIAFGSPIPSTAILLERRKTTFEANFVVVPGRPVDAVRLVNQPEWVDRFRKAIGVTSLELDAKEDRLSAAIGIRSFDALPTNAAFDVLLNFNGREQRLGAVAFIRDGVTPLESTLTIPWKDPPPSSVDVVLRANREVASRMICATEIWDGQLVYKALRPKIIGTSSATTPASRPA